MKPLNIYLRDTARKMVNSIMSWSDDVQKLSLYTITRQNRSDQYWVDNVLAGFDSAFNDGGVARCEYFADLGWEYSSQFGLIESPGFEQAQDKVLTLAVELLAKELKIWHKNYSGDLPELTPLREAEHAQ